MLYLRGGMFGGDGVLDLGRSGLQFVQQSNSYSKYNFYVDFSDGKGKDRVSGTLMHTTLSAGRVNADGSYLGEDVPAIYDGKLNTLGEIEQLVPYSENTAEWTGSGPWTQVIELTATGTYTLSTELSGATVSVVAGTATLDAGDSATLDNPDQFVVSAVGTITLSTDTADPKAQVTPTTYKLPYAVNTTSGSLTIPHGYSDDDEGYKWPIASCPKLFKALNGTDGTDAQGTIIVEWEPQEDTADLADCYYNLISLGNSTTPMYYRHVDGLASVLRTDSGANINICSTDTFLFVKGTLYTATIKYGYRSTTDTTVYKISVTDGTTTWESAITIFDGSFNPGDFLSIGYNNPYWQQIKSIKILEANPWD